MANITFIPVSHFAVQHPEVPPPGHRPLRKPVAQKQASGHKVGAPMRHTTAAGLTGLLDLGPAPTLDRAGIGGPAASPARSADLTALPDALLESIAACLAPRDLARLACVNRNLRDTLRPMWASHRVVAQAAGTNDLAAFRTTLRATLALEGGPALPATARDALAAWIEHIPSMQMEAFGEVLRTCAHLQPKAQADVLTALGPTLAKLPADLRDEACRHLLDAIGTLPAWCCTQPLRAVVTQFAHLPAAAREAAFEAVLQLAVRAAPGLQGVVLEALAGQIGTLPAEARLRSFQKLLNAASDGQFGQLIVQLVPMVAQLPRGARPTAFLDLRLSTARIPLGERSPVLVALANVVSVLPRDAQAAAIQGLLHSTE